MLCVEVSEGRRAIENLADEWDKLIEGSESAPFVCAAWNLAWLDAFPPSQTALITARNGDRLVGVLPLARIRTDARGLYLTLVGPISPGDYQPPIVDRSLITTVLPALLDATLKHFGRSNVYWWPNIPSTHPSLPVMRSYFDRIGMHYIEDREVAPRLHFDGVSLSTLEQHFPASHRKDIRRQRRRLSELGAVSLWQPSTLNEAEATLEEFFVVFDDKWLSQGVPGKFQDEGERIRYRSLLRRMWRRELHFSTVRCGSTNISYHFGFLAAGWLQWYRPTYRLDFTQYSPGKLHVAMLIEEGCRMGWTGIDFLLGTETYKQVWSNERVETVNIHAGCHPWAPSYLWFTRGKPLVKRHLQLPYFRAKAWLQKASQIYERS